MDYRPADILGNPEHWNFHTATQKVEEYSNTEFAISQYYENPADYKNDLEAALSSAHANLLSIDPQYAASWDIVRQEADMYQNWGFDPTRGATGRISSNTQPVPGGADFTPTQLVAARERSETIAANPPAGVRAQVTIPWVDSNGYAYVTTIRYYDWGSPNTQPEPTK